MDSITVSFLDSKQCPRCQEWQPITNFWKRANACKACIAAHARAGRTAKTRLGVPEGQRRCPQCKECKPTSDFSKDASACKQCNAAKAKAWYASHKERVRAYNATNAERIRTRRKAYSTQYYKERGEFVRYKASKWRKANPEKVRTFMANAKARRKGASGSHTTREWESLKALYGHRCLCCGRTEPDIKLTRDHVLPIVLGGSNDIGNIQPLCMSCNCSKQDTHVDYR